MHRYQFTVWALPFEKMEIPQGASNALVGFMLRANALEQATLTATYVNE
ncbi:phospholipid-binding protein [Vibrio cholerae]|nr:phospholipid-binding protein [Vibrio cholerae]